MSKTETNAQNKKPKVSKLAIVSPLVVVLGFFMALVFAGWLKHHQFLASIGSWAYRLSLPVGLITGIIGYYRIYKSKGLLTGRVLSISGTILALILIVPLLIPRPHPRSVLALRMICGFNLNSLGEAMRICANNYHNKYPTADKWCDLLLQNTKITEKQFVCRGAFRKGDKGRCHYAMNPNCEANSPPRMVLLFETKGGWNQHGGPELLTFENHRVKGCNILFNDGGVGFVKPERLGELNWDVEKKQNDKSKFKNE